MIKLASAAPTTGQFFQIPEYAAGMNAALAAVNAAGGVKGHKLALSVCDTHFTANGEVSCTRQMIASHPAAVVAPFLVADSSGASWPIIAAAGLPAIGEQGGTAAELNSPKAFLLGSAFLGPYAGTAVGLAKAGAKNVAILTDNPNPQGPAIASIITGVLKGHGITQVKNVTGQTASDPTFATAAAQATAGGVDGIAINGSPNDAATMIKALRGVGYKGKIAIASLLLPVQSLKALGSKADGVIVSDATAFVSDTSNPGVSQFLADMKKYEPSAAIDDGAVQGWSGMELFAKAAANATSFTPAGLTATFNAIKQPIDLGTSGPWSIVGKVGKVKGFSRIVNPTITLGVVKGGKVVAEAGGFVNPLGP